MHAQRSTRLICALYPARAIYAAPLDCTSPCAMPPLVERAALLAEHFAFRNSCAEMLAAHVHGGVVGEMGAGAGVGTAWITGTLGRVAHRDD
jgi:hypothetical protein